MGKKDDDKPDPKDVPGTPEWWAHHRDDAYCTECGSWYNAANPAEVNRHAH